MINLRPIWQQASTSIVIGAVVGMGVGAFFGFKFFDWLGGMAGLFLGAFLGATIGLDLVLVPIPTAGSRRPQQPPPFTSAIVLALIGLGAIILSLYAWGSLTFTCQRNATGWVDCQRGSTAWLGQVQNISTTFAGVRQATQSRSDLVVLATANSDHDMLFGLGPDTAARINRFLDSNEPALTIEENSLWYFPLVFLAFGVPLLIFSVPAFRSAQRKLAEKLGKSERDSTNIRHRHLFRPSDQDVPDSTTLLREDREQ